MAEFNNLYGNPPPGDFDSVVRILMNIFGHEFDKTSIVAIVDSCGGDLSQSIELLMEIVNSDNNINVVSSNQSTPQQVVPHDEPSLSSHHVEMSSKNPNFSYKSVSESEGANSNNNINVVSSNEPIIPQQMVPDDQQSLSSHNVEMSSENPSFSYASVSKSQGAIAKPKSNVSTPKKAITDKNSMKDIMDHHNNGTKILILLRGVPGSGKTYLAKEIVAKTVGPGDLNYKNHIFSTDDYFMYKGKYIYKKDRISEAHGWNQARVRNATGRGVSPIVIDNTNIKIWEMEPYIRYGVNDGYIIMIRRPKTAWAKNVQILSQKNSHNVPTHTIQRMLDNFEDATSTAADLIKMFNLCYPTDKVPPVLENFPTFGVTNDLTTQITNSPVEKELELLQINCDTNQEAESPPNNQNIPNLSPPKTQNNDLQSPKNESSDNEENTDIMKKYVEIEEQLTHFDKVVSDWDQGENWEDTSQCVQSNSEFSMGPKPQRIIKDNSISSNQCPSTNWENLAKSLQPWEYKSLPFIPIPNEEILIPVESRTSTTCVEAGDTDLMNNKYKIIVGTPRDINFYYTPKPEKIPRKRMLDKSSMTNEQLLTEASKCVHEEKHFTAFRKMFKNIATDDLREIFDKCCGDVNWAVEIVLDGVASNERVTVNIDDSIEPEEPNQDCNCPAAYDVVPDTTPESVKEETTSVEQAPELLMPKKAKKDKEISKKSIQIKKLIEKNVVIGDNHYSNHCLKIRKFRRGENLEDKNEGCDPVTEYCQPSTSSATNDDVQASQPNDAVEETVTVNLGPQFLLELDNLFGRRDVTYAENIVPLVSMPITTLNKINALWMESLSHQMSMQANYSELLLKEDAEFARQLAAKEEELAQEGKEPVVPDLKEIMDMELALSLYKKDVCTKWKSNEPNDIAARMSREKLYNLFPNLDQDTLSELLMAHDNNFITTVEVLLMSTGQAHLLEEKDGVNKFISQGEMARQGKLLEDMKEKALQDEEWPVLTKIGDDLDMSAVDQYRQDAQDHLEKRNINYQKAQDCIRRGMTQVASYYSEVAMFHSKKFTHNNTMAATALIQLNTGRDDSTVDLHYLFVAEAITTLDLFIDHHIQRLQETNKDGTKSLYFITGRGLHSKYGPKVKPAVRDRLRSRGLMVSEVNPGLLSTRISAVCKMTHQFQ